MEVGSPGQKWETGSSLVWLLPGCLLGSHTTVIGLDDECVLLLQLTVNGTLGTEPALSRCLIQHHSLKGQLLPMDLECTDFPCRRREDSKGESWESPGWRQCVCWARSTSPQLLHNSLHTLRILPLDLASGDQPPCSFHREQNGSAWCVGMSPSKCLCSLCMGSDAFPVSESSWQIFPCPLPGLGLRNLLTVKRQRAVDGNNQGPKICPVNYLVTTSSMLESMFHGLAASAWAEDG